MPFVIWCIHHVLQQPCPLRLPISIFHPMPNSFHQGEAMPLKPNPINRQSDLRTLLTRLNLGAMAEVCTDLALRATKEGLSHEAYLFELARHEEEQRTQRRTARLLRASGLPVEKTFRTFALHRLSPTLQFQLNLLKTPSFLNQPNNRIAIGKPGVGKSHAL